MSILPGKKKRCKLDGERVSSTQVDSFSLRVGFASLPYGARACQRRCGKKTNVFHDIHVRSDLHLLRSTIILPLCFPPVP